MGWTLAEISTQLRRKIADWGMEFPIAELSANASAGAASVTVYRAQDMPSEGEGFISRDLLSWTDKTATTLTGIPATGAFAIADHKTGEQVKVARVDQSELYLAINDAIEEYSRCRPRKTTTTISPSYNVRRYAIPANAKTIDRIYYLDSSNGEAETSYDFRVDWFSGKIVLVTPWSDSVSKTLTVDYTLPHTLYDTSDTSSETTLDADQERLLLLYAQAEIYRMIAGNQAAFYKWTRGQVSEDRPNSVSKLLAAAEKLEEQFRAGFHEGASIKSAGRIRTTDPVLARVPITFRTRAGGL